MPPTIGEIEAGNAFITLDLRTVGTWGRKIQQQAARLRSAAMQMGTAAILMATPFVAATKVYADFSKQMAFVGTMLDEPRKYMEKYTKTVREFSVEFGESTQTLSKGLYDILSASFAPTDALEILRVTTKAAKAGMADAAQATEAIISILHSYGLEAKDASYVSDVLFSIVRRGVLTFGDLAGHIGLVASTASIAGVSLEELGALLATMTRHGVRAEHAIVAINNIIKAFLRPTDDARKFAEQLRQLGYDIELSTSAIKRSGIIGIFNRIQKLPPEAIAKLFPTIRALRGVMPALKEMGGLLKNMEQMQNVTGATERAFQEVARSFGFLVDRIKQAGIMILSYVGESLAGAISNLGEKILDVATGFGEWLKYHEDLIVSTAKLIFGLGGLAVTLLVVAKAMALVGTISAVIAGPAGFARITAGLLAAWGVWQLMGKAIGDVKSEISEMADIGARKREDELKGRSKKVAEEIVKLNKDIAASEQAVVNARKDGGLLGYYFGPGVQVQALVLRGVNKLLKREAKIWGDWYEGLQSQWMQNYKTFKWWQGTDERSLRIEKERLEALKRQKEKELEIVKVAEKRAALAKKQAELLEKQSSLLTSIVGTGHDVYWSGYWHTPTLISSSSGRQSDEATLLTSIRDNTGVNGPIVRAIQNLPLATD